MSVSASTHQRLVHRQEFSPPVAQETVREISLDGGKVRLRTPQGDPCQWRDYKAVNLHEQGIYAFYQRNQDLVAWVNQQPLGFLV